MSASQICSARQSQLTGEEAYDFRQGRIHSNNNAYHHHHQSREDELNGGENNYSSLTTSNPHALVPSNCKEMLSQWNDVQPCDKTDFRGPFYGFTLKSSTWISDSHGLYDYETHNVSAKTYRCHGRNVAYRVLRVGVDVQLMSDRLGIQKLCEDTESATIAKITALEGGGYRIDSADVHEDKNLRLQYASSSNAVLNEEEQEDPQELESRRESLQFWLVLRSLRNGSLPLKPGDLIKLGRYGFKLKSIALGANNQPSVAQPPTSDSSMSGHPRQDDVPAEPATSHVRLPSRGRSASQAPPERWRDVSASSQVVPAVLAPIDSSSPRETLPQESANPARQTAESTEPGNRHSSTELAQSRNSPSLNEGRNGSYCSANGTTDDTGGHDEVATKRSDGLSSSDLHSNDNATGEDLSRGGELAVSAKLSGAKCCRICLCEEEIEGDDPLINPCTCKGSMRWVHLLCLRTWMQGRLNMKGENEGNNCFFWRPLECELCKRPYPTYVEVNVNGCGDESGDCGVAYGCKKSESNVEEDLVDKVVSAAIENSRQTNRQTNNDQTNNGQTNNSHGPNKVNGQENCRLVELFEIPKPQLPFVVLESKQNVGGAVGFHFLNFGPKNHLKMGRGHEADVRVTDISVSRIHAVLRYEPSPNVLQNILKENAMSTGLSSTVSGTGGLDKKASAAAGGGDSTPAGRYIRNALGHSIPVRDCQKPYVYISDLKSKFGTLLAVNEPIYLFPRMVLSLQVGRTVLTVYVRKPTWSRLLPSCFNLYYRGLIPHFRRRKVAATASGQGGPISNQLSADGASILNDSHDIRLIETHVPASAAANASSSVHPVERATAEVAEQPHENNPANNDHAEEADPLGVTRPVDFA